jgi:imidazolonepropionase
VPVLRNIGRLVTCRAEGGQADVHPVDRAAVAVRDGLVAWCGPEAALPVEFLAEEEHDAGGCLVVPGLVDCHTHLAFGGWRAEEFTMRALGAGYLEIAAAGRGIRSTMRDTRRATDDALVARSERFLDAMLGLGVTAVEAKTGYGLSEADEARLLDVYARLAASRAQPVVPTLLAAHVVPPEFEVDREGYVRLVREHIIPQSKGRARFCDVFVEDGAFTADEARAILRAAAAHGMRARLHVDQLRDGGGGELAAEVGAVSADHLEHTSAAGMRAMARAGVVAVALPFASLYLRQPPMNARAFIEAGCRVAVATDFNPGSAPSYHLPWALTLACAMSGLAPDEALKGATIHAARACGLDHVCGSVEPGKRADLLLLEAESVEQWLYHAVPNAARSVWLAGRPVQTSGASTYHGA